MYMYGPMEIKAYSTPRSPHTHLLHPLSRLNVHVQHPSSSAQVSWTRCTSLGVLTYGNGQHQSISIEPLCSSHQSYFYLVTNYFNPAALLIGTWYFIRAFLYRVMCLDVPHLSGLPWCAQLFLQHLTNLSYPGGHLAHGGGNGTSITFGRRHF